MFATCRAFNQDIGNWNVGKVKNMNYMFKNNDHFKRSYVEGKWNLVSKNTMFQNCCTATSAPTDKPTPAPGYIMKSNTELKDAVQEWKNNRDDAEEKYG